jgi:hypothetical protein
MIPMAWMLVKDIHPVAVRLGGKDAAVQKLHADRRWPIGPRAWNGLDLLVFGRITGAANAQQKLSDFDAAGCTTSRRRCRRGFSRS